MNVYNNNNNYGWLSVNENFELKAPETKYKKWKNKHPILAKAVKGTEIITGVALVKHLFNKHAQKQITQTHIQLRGKISLN